MSALNGPHEHLSISSVIIISHIIPVSKMLKKLARLTTDVRERIVISLFHIYSNPYGNTYPMLLS